MQGYLKIFVLRELSKKELTGYAMMKSFEKISGAKMPSPGTIYPLLNDLLKKRLIAMTVMENKKFYRITTSGRKVLSLLMEERKKNLRNMLPILSKVYSSKELRGMKRALEVMRSDRLHYSDMDVVHELRGAVFDFVASKDYQEKREEFRKIILATAKKIRELG